MSNRLYVGNLPFHATNEQITQRFIDCGEVTVVDVVIDRQSGRPRGFAFVEMASPQGAEKAIAELDGREFDGRSMRVRLAKSQHSKHDDHSRRGR